MLHDEDYLEIKITTHKDNKKVGTLYRINDDYKFEYDETYDSHIYFLMPQCDGWGFNNTNYKVDTSEIFYNKNEIFYEIADNFPEGWNLNHAIDMHGYNPHSCPLRYLCGVADDGIFKFEKVR